MTTLFLAIALLAAPGPVASPPLPVLRSGVETLSILDGDEMQSNTWRVSPDLDPDVYEAKLVGGRAHRVTFSSDIDAIHFDVEEGQQYDFVVLYRGRACRTRIVGTRFTPPAVFDETYRKTHGGTPVVEISEVYELVNVAIAMTPTGISDRNLVYHDSDYYTRMRAWFEPFREHPLLRALDAELVRDANRYFALKMNGYSFQFDDAGRIVQSPVYDRTGSVGERSNSLRPYLGQLQQFADASGFRRFYRENRALYDEQIAFFREQADLAGMLRWLDRNFPEGGYDGYKIVFSPLVAYNQSATWFVTPGYRELMAHVNFPYPKDLARSQAESLSPAAALLFRGNIVFTELNHGYINPQADRYASRASAAVADHDFWVDAAKGRSYYRGIETFNEYMNWGLVSLRFLDLAPAAERAGMIERIDRMMVERRGFRRFREFDTFLTALYLGRGPSDTLADLYPRILDWFEREHAPAPDAPK